MTLYYKLFTRQELPEKSTAAFPPIHSSKSPYSLATPQKGANHFFLVKVTWFLSKGRSFSRIEQFIRTTSLRKFRNCFPKFTFTCSFSWANALWCVLSSFNWNTYFQLCKDKMCPGKMAAVNQKRLPAYGGMILSLFIWLKEAQTSRKSSYDGKWELPGRTMTAWQMKWRFG